MGERGPAWTARLRGCGAMTILAGDRVLCTERFLRHRLPSCASARGVTTSVCVPRARVDRDLEPAVRRPCLRRHDLAVEHGLS